MNGANAEATITNNTGIGLTAIPRNLAFGTMPHLSEAPANNTFLFFQTVLRGNTLNQVQRRQRAATGDAGGGANLIGSATDSFTHGDLIELKLVYDVAADSNNFACSARRFDPAANDGAGAWPSWPALQRSAFAPALVSNGYFLGLQVSPGASPRIATAVFSDLKIIHGDPDASAANIEAAPALNLGNIIKAQ